MPTTVLPASHSACTPPPAGLPTFSVANTALLYGLPTLLFLAAIGVLGAIDADRQLAGFIYQAGGDDWVLRNHWLTKQLVHEHGRQLVAVMALAVAGCWVCSFFVRPLAAGRRVFAYLALAPVLAAVLVNILKQLTQLDCPYHVDLFGGSNSYLALFQSRSSAHVDHACFPAGHASAGYAWVALYFALGQLPAAWRARWPLLRPRNGLLFGLGLGLLFGISQQLRGAHFISHDIWTLYLCWITSAAVAQAMFSRQPNCREAARQ